jgi:8-oxo-dGTP pyrophosphatase MutT (NUDIX family)
MPDADELPPPTAELIGRARQFRLDGSAPVPPKPSATVVVLRDGPSGLETFMLRRVAAMAFAAGMHVFPGGVVDPSDASCPGLADPLVATAIRETFEETGLLLAAGEADPAALEADRLALLGHRSSLAAVLARHGLTPRADALHPWSRWITPEFEPRRYDTAFFVAAVRDVDRARDLGGESDAAGWVRPQDALAAADRGDWLLMPPTKITLREMLPYSRVADVVAAAARRDVRPIRATIDLDADPPAYRFRTAGEV